MNSYDHNILRVYRTKAQAKNNYDKISHFYDCFAGEFESNYRNMALDRLNIKGGETVLEIGFGTGSGIKSKDYLEELGLPLMIVVGINLRQTVNYFH